MLTEWSVKSNLAVGVGEESPQVGILYKVNDSLFLKLKKDYCFYVNLNASI